MCFRFRLCQCDERFVVQPVVSRFVATFLHIERCRMLCFGDALQVRERTAKPELFVALGIVFAGNFGK